MFRHEFIKKHYLQIINRLHIMLNIMYIFYRKNITLCQNYTVHF